MLNPRPFALLTLVLVSTACESNGGSDDPAQQAKPDAGSTPDPAPDAAVDSTSDSGSDAGLDAALPQHEGFPVSTPIDEGIDEQKLAALLDKAELEHSSAVVIVKNGRLVHEQYFTEYGGGENQALVAMSASKSVTSLAAGLAIADGALSLNTKVVDVVSELASDPKKHAMAVRHLLDHSSGLHAMRADMNTTDIVTHAASSPMVFSPGTSAQYNNNAVDLLAAVVGRAVGEAMDSYLDHKLFEPLGAQGQYWYTDLKGVPLGAGELFIRPIDAAKIGQVMLDGGKWHDEQVIPQSWVKQSFESTNGIDVSYGLLWWHNADVTELQITQDILDHWLRVGAPQELVDKVKPILGQSFATWKALGAKLYQLLTSSELQVLQEALSKEPHLPVAHATKLGPLAGHYASGWLGQFIVICTEADIVGVRMRAPTSEDYKDPLGEEVNGYRDFPKEVCKLNAELP